MMSNSKRQLLAKRKQQLIEQIELQRAELSAASHHWLQITAPYDSAWQAIIVFRPILIAATGLLSMYALKKPKKILSLGKKAFATWSIASTVRNAFNANRK